jgi:aspartyl-tRNA(Asn)/glutamyl-tRNA(Gln) amidotransferase subunit A
MELCDMTAHELNSMLENGDTSCSEITRSVVRRIETTESVMGSYITIDADAAMRRAASLDACRRPSQKPGPLWGIPIAVKDNICTKKLRTTCASRALEDFVPPYDATAVERLEQGGAIILGKTNMDEFGMGSSTEHSAFGKTRNPWDPLRVPGGSSGGSAAAVASGEAVVALGSDTGGSVRLPASFCGLVGLRPTYGAVSRYGLVAFASSMDQIGPIARDAADCAMVLQAIAGPDGRDSTGLPAAERSTSAPLASISLSGRRVGVPRALLDGGVHADVSKLFEDALVVLNHLGAEIVDVPMMDPLNAVAAYYIIADAEASSNLARYDGVRFGLRRGGRELEEMYEMTREDGFGTEVKRRILLGTFVLSAGYYDEYYLKASRVRNLIANDLASALRTVDWIALPSAATPAFMLGERLDDPLLMYLTDVFTVAPCLAGVPAVSLPMGMTSEGLPVGLQLIGRLRDEAGLLGAGHSYQQVTTHHTLRPPMIGVSGERSAGN